MVNTRKKFPREYGHGRANYINGPRVAVARSLPAKLDQVISSGSEGSTLPQRASWSGPQAPSFKRQALKASSGKRQAPSSKLQAPSRKRQAP